MGTNTTASQIYKVENANQCEVICPFGYYSYLPTKMCLSCAINCINMVISNQFILNGASLEFTYHFNDTMDLANLNYIDFLGFTCTNLSINVLSDFDIVYTIIDGMSFKLTLTPKPTKYLVDEDFCTVIKP